MTADSRQTLAYPPSNDPPIDLDRVVRLADFEVAARDRVHPAAWAYYAGGAGDEHTLRACIEAWDRFVLRPRVLVDVSTVDPSAIVLGRPAALPVGVAPAALHGLANAQGELATARAATAAGAIQVVSTAASHTVEDVADSAPGGRRWFQLYVQRNRTASRELVRRAERAGYEAICLTVDLPVLGYRDEMFRMVFDPGEDAYANLAKRQDWQHSADMDDNLDMRSVGLTWDHLDEVRSWSSLPLVLKGILTAEDAVQAVEHGADGVWVSNHGGRQLDRTAASIEVLDEVVRAVDGRAEVYLDGGVRRGPEVLIALALGATAVFTARPFLYALACAGEAGVAKAFAILRDEIERSMALLGTPSVSDIGHGHVARRGPAT
jgi:isopentenyl diphosphate isomerase/L-lactate dehydrogenase-like FMN-dependent dehydrogenase